MAFEDLGEHTVKNIEKPIRVYRVSSEVKPTVAGAVASEVDKLFERPAVAVLPFAPMTSTKQPRSKPKNAPKLH